MHRSDIHGARRLPQQPGLHADPRRGAAQGQPHEERYAQVEATAGGLARSTLKAGAAALVILTLFVLPGEYGVDPTGVGRLLGLTQMGEIKQQLYAEAEADDAATAAATPAPTQYPQILTRLDALAAQLNNIAVIVGAADSAAPIPSAPAPAPAAAPVVAAPAPAPRVPVQPAGPSWRDNASVTLPPGEGIEIKMAMEEGQTAQFEWSANGAVLNHDTHGDGGGRSVTYKQGRGVSGETGELTAAFSGNHGWFWRNRTDAPVTLTMRVGGEYSRFITP